MDKEFDDDIDILYNQDYDCTDIDGAVDGTDKNDSSGACLYR